MLRWDSKTLSNLSGIESETSHKFEQLLPMRWFVCAVQEWSLEPPNRIISWNLWNRACNCLYIAKSFQPNWSRYRHFPMIKKNRWKIIDKSKFSAWNSYSDVRRNLHNVREGIIVFFLLFLGNPAYPWLTMLLEGWQNKTSISFHQSFSTYSNPNSNFLG